MLSGIQLLYQVELIDVNTDTDTENRYWGCSLNNFSISSEESLTSHNPPYLKLIYLLVQTVAALW